MTVSEGTTGTYTVKLATLPSGSVTVAVTKKTAGTPDGDLSLTAGGSLTFTTSTWSTAQTVTLSAAEDLDGINGTAAFTHTASGGDYGSVSKEFTATESDNDAVGLTLNPPSEVTVAEGSTQTYTVRLATLPSASVTVAVTKEGDADLSVISGSPLTFSTSTWNAVQTVTLSAAQDLDALDDVANFTHAASGGGYGSVSVNLNATEEDDDTAALTLSPASVTVAEGSTKSYTVKLATLPSGNVTVAVARKSGQDEDLSVTAGASLTFSTSTWSTAQTVTLSAAQDLDAVDGSAAFTHTSSGADYGEQRRQRRADRHRGGRRNRGADPVGGERDRGRGQYEELHGEAGDAAVRQGDGGGGAQERPGRRPVGEDGFVADLHHRQL